MPPGSRSVSIGLIKPTLRKEALFNHYFSQRSLTNLQANITSLLQALSIANLIPDEWFPTRALETMLENKIEQIGVYRQVNVDSHLSLEPGGLRRQASTTIQTVEEIREKLATGRR